MIKADHLKTSDDGEVAPTNHQQINCQMIFDVKVSYVKLRTRIVGGQIHYTGTKPTRPQEFGATTDVPNSSWQPHGE